MYKTVSFNIFEENLEELVYGRASACETEKNDPAEKNAERKKQRSTEITIRPLNDQSSDRARETTENI
jgi:hypothetical protein